MSHAFLHLNVGLGSSGTEQLDTGRPPVNGGVVKGRPLFNCVCGVESSATLHKSLNLMKEESKLLICARRRRHSLGMTGSLYLEEVKQKSNRDHPRRVWEGVRVTDACEPSAAAE